MTSGLAWSHGSPPSSRIGGEPADRGHALKQPDWRSREFWLWAIETCQASTSALALWFPDTTRPGWDNRKRSARSAHGIDFPALSRSNKHDYPDTPPDGWPSVAEEEFVPPPPPTPLTPEERVNRDRELVKLRSQMCDLKARHDAAIREGVLEDRIVEQITAAVPKLPPCAVPTFVPHSAGRPETPVALVSDYHIGEVVSLEETGGINAYDFETFTRRWGYHVESIGNICFGKLTGYDFPELQIVALGDMVSGIIHDELVETSDGTLVDWLVEGAAVIAAGIRDLAGQFPAVRVDWLFGNHGRVTQKVRYKRRFVNYDYLLGHMVALHLADCPNVEVTVRRSFWSLIEVQGRHLLNLHGDNIKSWSGIPWYGIVRAVGNLTALLGAQGKRFDIVNLGHFHNAGLLDRIDCELVLNGSGIGGNEFSIGAMFTSTKPRQVIYGVHPEHGRTWQYALDLSIADSVTHTAR